MVRETVIRKILVGEVLGFAALIVLVWLNELLDLPHLVFGTQATPVNWAECLIESLVVAFLAMVVLIWSDALLGRIKYLEGFLPVCRGCRRIRVGDEWMPFETYVQRHWEEAVSQGLCPDCCEKRRSLEQSVEARARAREQSEQHDSGQGSAES